MNYFFKNIQPEKTRYSQKEEDAKRREEKARWDNIRKRAEERENNLRKQREEMNKRIEEQKRITSQGSNNKTNIYRERREQVAKLGGKMLGGFFSR